MRERLELKDSVACVLLAALMPVLTLAPVPASAREPEPITAQPALPEKAPPEAAIPEERSPPATGRELRARRLDELFARLAERGNPDWRRIQDRIRAAWARSGSPTMDLLLQRAEQAMREKDLGAAMAHLDDLVRLAPDFAEGWNRRATVRFLRGEYDASVADIRRTLALEPRHFGALSGLGAILDRIGDKEGALLAYRRVLEVHPNMETAREAVERLSLEVGGREL